MNSLEFNVELKDYANVKFALDKFEELRAQDIDIRETYIHAIEQNTWLVDIEYISKFPMRKVKTLPQ